MSRFISVDRSTEYLLPPSVQDWLPENHLARFVVDVVERLDLSALIKAYAGRGKDAHHPAVLLGLLIYGYATGVYHSRKIERASYESLAFRYIAANTHPDHDTIASFRVRFNAEISELFVRVLLVAREMKLVKLGAVTVAVDVGKLGQQTQSQRLPAQSSVMGASAHHRDPPQSRGGSAHGKSRSR